MRATPAVFAAAIAMLSLAACKPLDAATTSPNESNQSRTATRSTTAHPGSPAQLSHLVVRPESNADYDRENWEHWDYIGDGCDVRDKVLIEQGTNVQVGDDCDITSGTWTSIYDGIVVHDSSELDIDHRVALSEAAESGGFEWSKQKKKQYANDTRLLVAVTAHSNRSKGGSDPAEVALEEWLRPQRACEYAHKWIQIKNRYDLSIDQAERDELARVLSGC